MTRFGVSDLFCDAATTLASYSLTESDGSIPSDLSGLGLTCARVFWLTCARANNPPS